jgi:hypothetical protein
MDKIIDTTQNNDPYRIIRHAVIAPFIYLPVLPIILLDLVIEIYHHVCFPLYRKELVDRGKYIRIDRHRLAYLNVPQKLFCAYCGYANGVMAYWVKIAGETESYWCNIQHQKDKNFNVPNHHKDFAEYGDEDVVINSQR